MKTYKTKASVKRAMVNELVKKGFEKEAAKVEFENEFEYAEKDGEFYARRIQRTKEATGAEEGFKKEDSRREVVYNKAGDPIVDAEADEKVEKNMVAVEIDKSVATKPCNLVWEIAIAMNSDARKEGHLPPTRKQVIAMCVKAGVAYNTARTQYQAWFKANKGQ